MSVYRRISGEEEKRNKIKGHIKDFQTHTQGYGNSTCSFFPSYYLTSIHFGPNPAVKQPGRFRALAQERTGIQTRQVKLRTSSYQQRITEHLEKILIHSPNIICITTLITCVVILKESVIRSLMETTYQYDEFSI